MSVARCFGVEVVLDKLLHLFFVVDGIALAFDVVILAVDDPRLLQVDGFLQFQ